ncbi:MAG: tRNA (guanosine(46)-N7)-methyltransferase TrmB [Trueperaceae bacterium]
MTGFAPDVATPPPYAPPADAVLLPWRRLAHPVDWAAAFGRRAPLHLEVGFGDGRFTARRALAEPDADFVGLEVSGTSVLRAWRRMRRDGVRNVRLLKAPAEVAVRQLFGPNGLASITVNFPDPWPKDRHEHHRLLRAPFFRLAATRLVPGGEIRLASDHEPYVAFAVAEAERSGVARGERREPPPEVLETKYALKWRGQGKPLFYEVFVLDGTDVPYDPPIGRSDRMPHALLTGVLPTEAPAFEKLVVAAEGGHVVVHEAARALGRDDRWLFRVTLDEGELIQQLLVVAQRRAEGELIVRLESFGDPLVTPAARAAVAAVTDWLEGSVGLRVAARNY